jgi:endonuclease/exonuclease/phosphatase family metal-dependent hydrolase
MDYKLKYLKYKQKYIDLKNQLSFVQNDSFKQKYIDLKYQLSLGGRTNDSNLLSFFSSAPTGSIAKKFTKGSYDILRSDEARNKFPFYCPDDKPYLCSKDTTSFGLCKHRLLDCNNYTGENTYAKYDLSDPQRKRNFEYGKQFAYDIYKNPHKDCSRLIENSKGSFEGIFIAPKKFKIMTYNCWWNWKVTGDPIKDKFYKSFFETRMNSIANVINESTADIVCLQEVGRPSFEILQPLLKDIYPYYYETPFAAQDHEGKPRVRFSETVCFSKFPAKAFKLVSVEGSLHYNNSMIMVEFDNLVVLNVYLQAGTRNSPGQKDLWFNYSRCRYNEYLAIDKFLKDNRVDILIKPIVVLGDFNTDLNGKDKDWPELKAFKQLNLQDSWLEKYDDISGFTENTDVNFMRWNSKFEPKILRIDGIFYNKGKLKTNEIKLLGDKPIDISKEMQGDFYKYRMPSLIDFPNKNELIKKNSDEIQIWPSDHFAVMADLEII